MSKTITVDAGKDERIDYKAEINKCLAQIEKLNAKMLADDKEIARLSKETWEVLNRLKSM